MRREGNGRLKTSGKEGVTHGVKFLTVANGDRAEGLALNERVIFPIP